MQGAESLPKSEIEKLISQYESEIRNLESDIRQITDEEEGNWLGLIPSVAELALHIPSAVRRNMYKALVVTNKHKLATLRQILTI